MADYLSATYLPPQARRSDATHFHIGSPDGSPVNREDLDALDAEYDALNSSMSHMGSDPEVRSRDLLSEEDQTARKGDAASASAHSGEEDFIRDIPSPQKKRRQSANSALARLSSTSSSGSMENRSRAVAYPRPDDIYPPRDSVTGARAYAFGSRPAAAVSGHLRAEAEFSAEEDEPRLDERTAEERVVGPASGGTDTDTQVFPDGAVEVGEEYDFDAGAEFAFSAEEDELRLDERTAEEDQAPADPEPEFSAEEDELRLDERTDEDEEDIWRDACLADMPVARSQCETSSPMNVDVAQNAASVEVGAGDCQPSPCDREIADDPHIIYFDGELGGEGDTATESEALSDTNSGTPYQAPSAAALSQQSVGAGMELSRISEASCESNKVEYGSSPGDGSEGSSCGARTPVGGAADAKKSAARRSASDGVVDESDAEQDGARFLHIPFPSSANNCTSEAAQQFSGMERVPLVNDAVDADTLENKSVEAAILHLSCQEELSRVVSHVLSLSGEEDVCDAVGASPLPPVSMGSDARLQDETPENRTRRDAGLLSPERMSLEDLPAGPSSVRRDMSKVDSLTKLAEAAATFDVPATATVSDDIKTTAFRSDLGRFKFDISPEGEDVPLGEALDRLMRRREEMRLFREPAAHRFASLKQPIARSQQVVSLPPHQVRSASSHSFVSATLSGAGKPQWQSAAKLQQRPAVNPPRAATRRCVSSRTLRGSSSARAGAPKTPSENGRSASCQSAREGVRGSESVATYRTIGTNKIGKNNAVSAGVDHRGASSVGTSDSTKRKQLSARSLSSSIREGKTCSLSVRDASSTQKEKLRFHSAAADRARSSKANPRVEDKWKSPGLQGMHVPARLHPTGTFDPAPRGNNLYANSKRANDEFVNGLRDSPRASPNTSRIGDLSSICDAQSPAQRRSSLSTHRALQLSSISEGHVLLSKSELQTSRRKAKELTSRSGQPNGRKGPTTGRSAGRDVVTSKPGGNPPSSTAATGSQGEVDASARRDSEAEVARPRSKSDGQVTGASSSLSRKRSSLTKDCTLATKAKTPSAPGARSGNQHGQPGARDYLQALLHLRTRTTSGDWSEGSSLALHELESILELHDRTMLGGKSSESDEEKGSLPSDDSSKELEDLVSPVGAEEVAGGQGAFPPVAGGENETTAAATIERGKFGESVENVLGAGEGAAASPGVDEEVAGENDRFFCADSDKTERASHDALQGTDAAVVAESECGAANVNGSEPGAPESCITQTHKRSVARGSPGASPEDEAEFAPPPRSFDIDTATPSPPRLEIPQPFSVSPSDTVCQRADVELVLAAAPSPDSTASPGIWKISAPTDDTDAEDQRSSAEGWSGSCAENPAMVRQRDELQVLPEEGLRKDSSAARILANIQQICSSNLHRPRTPEVKTPPPVPTSSPVFEFTRQDLARFSNRIPIAERLQITSCSGALRKQGNGRRATSSSTKSVFAGSSELAWDRQTNSASAASSSSVRAASSTQHPGRGMLARTKAPQMKPRGAGAGSSGSGVGGYASNAMATGGHVRVLSLSKGAASAKFSRFLPPARAQATRPRGGSIERTSLVTGGHHVSSLTRAASSRLATGKSTTTAPTAASTSSRKQLAGIGIGIQSSSTTGTAAFAPRTRTLATSTGPSSDRAALQSRGAVGSAAGAATTSGGSKVTGSRLSTTSEKRRASSARGPAIGGSRAKMIAPDGTMQSMLDLAQEITEKIRSFQTLSAQTSRIEADDGGAAAAATSLTNSSVSSASSVCKTVHGRSAAVRAAHLRPPLAAAPSMHRKPPVIPPHPSAHLPAAASTSSQARTSRSPKQQREFFERLHEGGDRRSPPRDARNASAGAVGVVPLVPVPPRGVGGGSLRGAGGAAPQPLQPPHARCAKKIISSCNPQRMLAVLQREMQSDHSTHAGDSELSSAAPSPAELPVPGAAQVAGGAKEAAHDALVLHNPAVSVSPGAQVEDVSAVETEYPAASPAAPQLVDAPAPLKSTATIRVFAPTDATSSKASCDAGAASGASLAASFRAHTPPTSATCVAAANGLQACASQRALATAKVNTSSDEKYFQLRQNELGLVKQTKNPPGLTGNKKWETDRWALADYDANSAALNELLASEGLPDEDFELGLMAEVGSTATDVVKFSPSTSFEHLLLRKKLGVHFAEHPASAAGTRKEQARGTLFQPSPMSGYSADSERAMSGINSPSPVDI